jgi:prolyl oligopeptidase
LSLNKAPRGKILELNLKKPSLKQARLFIPEGDNTIISSFGQSSKIIPMDDILYIAYQLGGPSEIQCFNYRGERLDAPELLPISTVHEMIPLEDNTLLFSNSSYINPKIWYSYDPSGEQSEITTLSNESAVDFSDCEVIRDFATSKDGTKIPVNIIRKKDISLNGNNPTILYGYGGYGISRKPAFSAIYKVWIEQGGVYAIANIRGGGEYGEEWHKAGMLTNKQNVFDDFAAAMQYLIEKKYTNSTKLAIRGGSNGGLLMGAMITQHPDLFKATVSTVGIYDMIRVELSPNGMFNIPEFGTVEDEEQFKALYAYSPYHRVKDGTAYPAILFMTGANDPRVDPMQSRKMTARLQKAKSSDNPVLLRTSSKTGHGGGTPLSDKIEEYTDQYSFLFHFLDVEYSE